MELPALKTIDFTPALMAAEEYKQNTRKGLLEEKVAGAQYEKLLTETDKLKNPVPTATDMKAQMELMDFKKKAGLGFLAQAENVEDIPEVLKRVQEYNNDVQLRGIPSLMLDTTEFEKLAGASQEQWAGYRQKALKTLSNFDDKPEIKEFNIGDRLVTKQYNKFTGEWEQMAEAPRYKPAGTNISLNIGDKGLSKLSEKMGESLSTSYDEASKMAVSLQNLQPAKQLIEQGIITGTGANYLVEFGKGLNRIGFNVAQDEIANTEAYAATMGNQVAQIIKQFGSGTGLSDADREYAEKISGGKITLTETSLKKIINLNESAYVNLIKLHNSKSKEVMKKEGADQLPFSLIVDIPDTKVKPREMLDWMGRARKLPQNQGVSDKELEDYYNTHKGGK